MAEVQRGNVFLTIQDDEIEKYMAKGFSVVDKYGRVIRESIPTELSQLQKAYSEHLEIIKKKDAEISKLKSELKAAKTAGVEESPAVEPDEDSWDESWVNTPEKPAKKTKKPR